MWKANWSISIWYMGTIQKIRKKSVRCQNLGDQMQRGCRSVAVLLVPLIIPLALCARHSETTIEEATLQSLHGRPLLLLSGKENVTLTRYSSVEPKVRHQRPYADVGALYLIRVDEKKKSYCYDQLVHVSTYVQYLPHDTFQALLRDDMVDQALQIDGVVAIFVCPPELKFPPDSVPKEEENAARACSLGCSGHGKCITTTCVCDQGWMGESCSKFLIEPDPSVIRSKRRSRMDNKRTLLVSLAHDIEVDDANYFCEGFEDQICNVHVSFASRGKRFSIDIDESSLSSVLLRCTEHPLVIWVEEKQQMTAFNKYASSIIQGSESTDEHHRPFWNAGLTGDGEIIGIADTGLDADSCFFNDSNVTVPRCIGLGFVDEPACVNHNHRKIVSYRTLPGSDFGDEFQGHGTHVAGSALGSLSSPAQTNGSYSGMAPGAKVSFDDISLNATDYLNVPDDLYAGLMQHAYGVGARIHSFSFGSGPPLSGYDLMAFDVDRFMYDHPDHLVLVAAGNDGPYPYSVGSPAVAKNSLAVGASGQPGAALLEYGLLSFPVLRAQAGPERNVSMEYAPAGFGARMDPRGAERWTGMLGMPDSWDACEPLNTSSGIEGKVALLWGQCRYEVAALNAQLGGAIAVIFVGPSQLSSWEGFDSPLRKSNVTIPVVMVSFYDGIELYDFMMTSGAEITMPFGLASDEPDRWGKADRLAWFSSKGPLNDLRTKPDVVCPGENIRSAESHGGGPPLPCGAVFLSSGTSMATPICAGAAALVRQYFREGFYAGGGGASGQRGAGEGRVPSGALVKAVLVQGATLVRYLQGYYTEWATQGPSSSQGYGRVNLSSSLPLAGGGGFDLTIWDDADASVSDDGSFRVCLRVRQPGGRLRVTVAWTDPPASPLAGRALVNDLDLTAVSKETGQFWLGNSAATWNSLTGYSSAHDRLNNVEQVTIPDAGQDDVIAVRVYGASVPIAPQQFAMVVTGPHTVIHDSECLDTLSACPGDCAGNGVCKDGRCHCRPLWSGLDCRIPNRLLECNQTLDVLLQGDGWAYVVLDLPSPSWTWKVDIQLAGSFWSRTMPDIRAAFGRLPGEGDSLGANMTRFIYSDVQEDDDPTPSGFIIMCEEDCVASKGFGAAVDVWVVAATTFRSAVSQFQMTLSCIGLPMHPEPEPICSIPAQEELCCTRSLKNPAALLRVKFNSSISFSSLTVWTKGYAISPLQSLESGNLYIGIGYSSSVTGCEIGKSENSAVWNQPSKATVNSSTYKEWIAVCGTTGDRIEFAMPVLRNLSSGVTLSAGRVYVRLCTLAGSVDDDLKDGMIRIRV